MIYRGFQGQRYKEIFCYYPPTDQQKFVTDLINHWKSGFGARYNVDRKEAIEVLEISASIGKLLIR
jgi:hypothetical protein